MLQNKALEIYDRIEYLERIFNTDRWSILSEEQSTFPFAKAILDCVFYYMKENKEKSKITKDDNGTFYMFVIPYDAFRLIDTFFYGIDLTINCYERNMGKDNDPYMDKSSYYVSKDAKLIQNYKLYKPEIVINYTANWGEMYYDLIAPLMHEFLHAYENYKRLLNKAPSLETTSNSNTYEKINEYFKKAPKSPSYHIALMFYFTTKCERNAFISQMHGEIKTLSKNNKFKLSSISDIIKKLSLYKEFKGFDDDIAFFKYNDDARQRQETFNAIKDLSGKNFSSYQEAVNYLEGYITWQECIVIRKLKRIIKKYQDEQGGLQEGVQFKLKESLRRKGYTKSVLEYFEWFDNMVNYEENKEKK